MIPSRAGMSFGEKKMNTLKLFGMLVLMFFIGTIFFALMAAGQIGFIQHMSGTLPSDFSVLIAWSMPVTMLLFLLYGTGVFGEFLKPLEQQGSTIPGTYVSVFLTAFLSYMIYLPARVSPPDTYFIAAVVDVAAALAVLIWFLLRLSFDKQCGLQSTT
ncbi:hypothetical protein KJ848_02785 [Patescibacteria group bacterium]|nr:hypothetical protein [Patescibacteria group bacterium]